MGPYDIDMGNTTKAINDAISKRIEGNIKRYLYEKVDTLDNSEEKIRLSIIKDIMAYYEGMKDQFSDDSQSQKIILDIIKIVNK